MKSNIRLTPGLPGKRAMSGKPCSWPGTALALTLVLGLPTLPLRAQVEQTQIVQNAVTATVTATQANIGTATTVPLPPEAPWAGVINIRPGSNETVTLNPPIFSWLYAPGNPTNSACDATVYTFLFQADYNGTFANPVVNVLTESCCYNMLAPFTNGNTVYWRIGYLSTNHVLVPDPANKAYPILSGQSPGNVWITNSWITNSFTISPTATNWDRSMLADTNYLASRSAHPHLLFTAANQAAIAHFVQTNDTFSWGQTLTAAQNTIASSWWTAPVPWDTNWTGMVYTTNDGWASQIENVAFVWMITGNPSFTNNLLTNYDNLVQYYIADKLWQMDYGQGYDPNLTRALCFGYDWLYPLMNTQEQSNALYALQCISRSYVYNWWWMQPMNTSIAYLYGNFDPLAQYPGPYWVPWTSNAKRGFTHGFWGYMNNWLAGFAGYGENADCANFLNMSLNFLVGRGTPYGTDAGPNLGRVYGQYVILGLNGDGVLDQAELLQMDYPEAKFNKSPFWSETVDWYMRMMPAGYTEPYEQWGDGNNYRPYTFYIGTSWRDLANYTGSGPAAMTQKSELALDGFTQSAAKVDAQVKPYYYPPPTPIQEPSLSRIFPADGWVFGNSVSPSSTNAFLNGVGFIFEARPRGGMWGHEAANDLNFEIWAYGANVTASPGGGNWASKASWGYNIVTVNGLGMGGTEEEPFPAVQAQILAYTNAADYIYCAGDATQAYPHFNFPHGDPNGWLVPAGYYQNLNAAGAQNYLTKVQRHVLFVHHQYFVIYDDLAASTNVTYSWVYHVWQDTVANLTSGGSFQYTAPRVLSVHGVNVPNYSSTPLNVIVQQIVNPALLTSTNMYGTNAVSNPITGENYYNAYTNDGNGGKYGWITNSIWVSNITPTNKFHFLTVVYPVAPGATIPTISRIDDYTVGVTNGGVGDVISFNAHSANTNLTMLVNSPYIAVPAGPTVLPPPTGLRIIGP